MSFCASIRLLSVVALAAAWAPKPRFATPSSSRTPRSRPLGFTRGERVRARCSPSRRLSPLRAVPVDDLCYTAWEWCANLGAPAALVGGGAAASYYEMRDRGALEPRVGDARAVVAVKKLVFLLLLSSFALSLALASMRLVIFAPCRSSSSIILSLGFSPITDHHSHLLICGLLLTDRKESLPQNPSH